VMTKRISVLVALMASVAIVIAVSADGNTGRALSTRCGLNSGNYGNYEERYVLIYTGGLFSWTDYSEWTSDQPYYARRKDSSYNITYEVFVSPYGYFDTPVFSPIAYRTSSMKNQNGAGAVFWLAQWAWASGTSC